MLSDLSGKRIVVTGGAQGIGGAAVAAFVAAGARVLALDLSKSEGDSLTERLDRPDAARFRYCDVSSTESVDAAFAFADEWLGGIDVLVALAGIDRVVPAEEITEAQFRQMFEVHTVGTFLTNQAAFKRMRETGGRIVNCGSSAAIRGLVGHAHYAAAKGAILAWTRGAALEWGRYKITVNAICPWAYTRLLEQQKQQLPPDSWGTFDAAVEGLIPLRGGLLRPEIGIAPVLVFLASDAARFISGQTISIDGGVMMLGS